MFADTLVESSPSRVPLLRKRHYTYATAAGVIGSLAWLLVLGRLFYASPIRAIAIQSLLIGMGAAVFGLMLCYVDAESRRLALNARFWVALTCVLNVPGFVGFLVYVAAKTGDWKRAAIPCAYVGEVFLVAAMALVPLIYTEALPKTVWREMLQTLMPPPPPPAPSSMGTQAMHRAPHRLTADELLRAPSSIPPKVELVRDEPLPPSQFPSPLSGIVGAIPNGQAGAALDPVLQTLLRNAGPQPPPLSTTPKPAPQRLIRGSELMSARIIYQPKPEYPELARMTRTEGDVVFEAVIGKDGTIEGLKVLKGHPLLVKAALDAVRQWRYQPTLLDGEPVEVMTEITVSFKLNE